MLFCINYEIKFCPYKCGFNLSTMFTTGGDCPANAKGALCFQAGVKGCYPKGKQPSKWFTHDIRCVANKDCFCYHAPKTTTRTTTTTAAATVSGIAGQQRHFVTVED